MDLKGNYFGICSPLFKNNICTQNEGFGSDQL